MARSVTCIMASLDFPTVAISLLITPYCRIPRPVLMVSQPNHQCEMRLTRSASGWRLGLAEELASKYRPSCLHFLSTLYNMTNHVQ
jgi:hypothetical protein